MDHFIAFVEALLLKRLKTQHPSQSILPYWCYSGSFSKDQLGHISSPIYSSMFTDQRLNRRRDQNSNYGYLDNWIVTADEGSCLTAVRPQQQSRPHRTLCSPARTHTHWRDLLCGFAGVSPSDAVASPFFLLFCNLNSLFSAVELVPDLICAATSHKRLTGIYI